METATPGEGAPVAIGIDIGGTGTRFVAVEPVTGDVLSRHTVPTPQAGGPDTVNAFLRKNIHAVAGARLPVAAGIGASGPIDANGIIRNPDTLPAFSDLPITEIVAAAVSGPVFIDNDAVCAALAERRIGAARQSPRSLHITLGTGVGVCLLDGDTPFRLPDGTHPEGGHIAVSIATTPCYCGRGACWEQAASRRTLQHSAARILGRTPTDARVIDDLAASNDCDARQAFHAYGSSIAAGLATLLTLYGPDLVVIGGSAARHLPLYRKAIHEALATLGRWIPSQQIVGTRLNDYGGAIGGAHLALTALMSGFPTRCRQNDG
jgi:glucokinase